MCVCVGGFNTYHSFILTPASGGGNIYHSFILTTASERQRFACVCMCWVGGRAATHGAPEICERVCKKLLDVVIILSVTLWPKNATWNTNSNAIERERLFSLRMLNKDTVNFSIIAFIHFINL